MRQVTEQAVALALEGVDFFQIREKDIPAEVLFALSQATRDAVQATGAPMRVVLNGPREIAERAAVAWHRQTGVGLPDRIENRAFSVSCHTAEDVERERESGALLLFGPVYEKRVRDVVVRNGQGTSALADAVERAAGAPVLALGGVTSRNVSACLGTGAAGIASIRMFLRGASVARPGI